VVQHGSHISTALLAPLKQYANAPAAGFRKEVEKASFVIVHRLMVPCHLIRSKGLADWMA
jgi:hypothetical protein